jgi:hypothetical protein
MYMYYTETSWSLVEPRIQVVIKFIWHSSFQNKHVRTSSTVQSEEFVWIKEQESLIFGEICYSGLHYKVCVVVFSEICVSF